MSSRQYFGKQLSARFSNERARVFAVSRRPTIITAEDESPIELVPEKPFVEKVYQDFIVEKPKELLADLTQRPLVYAKIAALGGAGFLAVLVASSLSAGFHKVPLLPNFFQLIGFGYIVWFAYRYLLFADNRKELKELIESFIGKI
eukprot:CAMPEP_0184645300 /NCGR_PEP_ID=MMETSP0308-20130426/1788_1 /TAXON_ID=38269 /ORGANISM="Gloeochaete witrockiana, Strain SAG 46.84" /LENGTH=145 /DNA_ID=CAMNT_0027074199 /DNA_START=195 /DNA_END=632 /DNA_ORIENTATION=+